MRFLKKLVIFLIVVAALAAAGAFLIPSHYKVERSVVIQAKPDAIFPHVNQLKRWEEWTPWTKELDPTMKRTFSGPEQGAGAVMAWTGEKTGNGTMKLTASDPVKSISYELDFEQGKHKSTGVIAFEPSGGGTQVKWTNEGDAGMNPISRYSNLLMDKFMGPDFQKGLDKLKTNIEAKK